MAKVIIELDDMAKDGDTGLSVDVKFEPEYDGEEDPTIAQAWAVMIINMITSEAGRVDFVDEDGTTETVLNPTKPKNDTEVH